VPISHLSSRHPLRDAARSPLSAIARGYRFWRQYDRPIRRARLLRACADGLSIRRPAGWQPRAERLYRRALRTAGGALSSLAGDEAAVARWGDDPRAQLDRATEPYHALAAGLAVVGALLAALSLAGILLAAALSPRVQARLFPRNLARGRAWTASSADAGAALRGVGPSTHAPFFFATTSSDHPWLQIDLGRERLIRSFRVENRTDCCENAALPLNIEILDGNAWRLVAQRRSPFAVWNYDVRPVRAQQVRVRLAGSGSLRLRAIAVFGE
jgi:hypothetical protein